MLSKHTQTHTCTHALIYELISHPRTMASQRPPRRVFRQPCDPVAWWMKMLPSRIPMALTVVPLQIGLSCDSQQGHFPAIHRCTSLPAPIRVKPGAYCHPRDLPCLLDSAFHSGRSWHAADGDTSEREVPQTWEALGSSASSSELPSTECGQGWRDPRTPK